jgi:ABC-type Fe3+ transport system permease subunit
MLCAAMWIRLHNTFTQSRFDKITGNALYFSWLAVLYGIVCVIVHVIYLIHKNLKISQFFDKLVKYK